MAIKRLTEQELGQCKPAEHNLKAITQPYTSDEGIVPSLVVLAFCLKCGNTALIKLDEGKPSMPGRFKP